MRNYTVHVYMLYLLQFNDGKVVFEKDQLRTVKQTVHDAVNKYGSSLTKSEAEFDTYALEIPALKKWVKTCAAAREENDWTESKDIKILEADIGYYHHRFISHCMLKIAHADLNGQIRRFRGSLQKYSNFIVHACREGINALHLRDKNDTSVHILGFYDYQLIIVENSSDIHKSLQVPYSFQTTSLCFDIVKPTSLIERRLLVRISIPCTIVYGHIQVDKSLIGKMRNALWPFSVDSDKTLVRDLINAIYQQALYGRKTRLSEMEEAKKAEIDDPYKIDEQDLQSLWAYMIDTMGGKTSNLYAFKVIRVTLSVTIAALVFTIGTLVYDKIKTESPAKETGQAIETPVDKTHNNISAPNRHVGETLIRETDPKQKAQTPAPAAQAHLN